MCTLNGFEPVLRPNLVYTKLYNRYTQVKNSYNRTAFIRYYKPYRKYDFLKRILQLILLNQTPLY